MTPPIAMSSFGGSKQPTGDRATLAENGQSFEDVAEQRIGSPDNTKSNRFDQNPELLGVVSQ